MIYSIGGIASVLPVFWQAVTDQGCINQVGSNGLPKNYWQDLDVSTLKYFGIVCKQGKIGFDLESQMLLLNGIPIKFDNIQTFSGEIFFERQVITTLGGESITEAICFGVGTFKIKVNFHPNFFIDFCF